MKSIQKKEFYFSPEISQLPEVTVISIKEIFAIITHVTQRAKWQVDKSVNWHFNTYYTSKGINLYIE